MRSLLLAALLVAACGKETASPPPPTGPADEIAPYAGETPPVGQATPHTAAHNKAVAGGLPLDDETDLADVERGFLAALEDDIVNAKGEVVWPVRQFDFLAGDPTPTVNPSLWRQSRLAARHGLFEVTDGIWQVRGYDLAVMTIVRGRTGWVVIDPLTTRETAAAALGLVNDTLGARPVSAVVYTHSHVDHFGGARGVLEPQGNAGGGVPIIAPEGFTEHAVAENLLAGVHMSRRAGLMFGNHLPRNAAGHVGSGLGPGLPNGTIGLVLPNDEVPASGGVRSIDGVLIEFLDAGGTEAPSEFVFYLPQFKALCTAEIATHTFHNVLTMRGAKARDALKWSRTIDRMLARWGDKAEVAFASHHWPTWGGDEIRAWLEGQRDVYRYVHDQTLRLANAGARPEEIAEEIGEPAFLAGDFAARGYYGSMEQNAKAAYQYYFGWWAGVPADFMRHPPEPRAQRFVAAVGGRDAALSEGRRAFSEGDYRWAAEVLNNLVFAAPDDEDAKAWLAAAYEQMGFQAESGAQRSYFLAAAQELRVGPPANLGSELGNSDFLAAVSTDLLFDALAARFDPAKLGREPFALAFRFEDRREEIWFEVGEAVATPRYEPVDGVAATVTVDRADFDRLMLRKANVVGLMARGRFRIDGERAAVTAFFDALDETAPDFALVTP